MNDLKRVLKKVDNALALLEKGLVVGLFSVFVTLILFNIVTRNVFQISFQRALEIPPAIVLWLALLGSTLGLKYQRHIRLELLLRYCSAPVKQIAAVTTGLFGAAVTGALFYVSLGFMKSEIAMFGGWGWVAIIFPLFFALSCLRFLAIAGRIETSANSETERPFSPDTDKATGR